MLRILNKLGSIISATIFLKVQICLEKTLEIEEVFPSWEEFISPFNVKLPENGGVWRLRLS